MKNSRIRFWVGLIIILALNAPLYWVINISLMPEYAVRSFPPKLFPSPVEWNTYGEILFNTSIVRWMLNSFIVGAVVVFVALAAGIPGGYSLSRFRYKSTRFLGLFMLVSQMLPATLLAIPLFIVLKALYITTTPAGNFIAVIISHCALVVPVMVWMLKGYFDTIPVEIEESAWIDGCSGLRTLWTIVLPLAKPGIAAAALYGFVLSWNDFVFARSFLAASKPMWTMSLGIASFRGEFITPWNQVMAASLISTIPILIIVIVLQKHFVSGLTSGSVK